MAGIHLLIAPRSISTIEANQRLVKLDTLREHATNIAAMQSARPIDRCETWRELATTLSRVHEVWNTCTASSGDSKFREVSSVSRKCIPLDVHNGLPLIATLDALFDARLISFDTRGRFEISRLLTVDDRRRLGIAGNMRLSRTPAKPQQEYLLLHEVIS